MGFLPRKFFVRRRPISGVPTAPPWLISDSRGQLSARAKDYPAALKKLYQLMDLERDAVEAEAEARREAAREAWRYENPTAPSRALVPVQRYPSCRDIDVPDFKSDRRLRQEAALRAWRQRKREAARAAAPVSLVEHDLPDF